MVGGNGAGTSCGTARDTENGDTRAAGREAGSGMAYLRRRREQLSAQQLGRRQAVADAERVHDGLSRVAIAARLHAPQAPQLTRTSEPMVLNGAYLLDEQQGDGLRQVVAALAAECLAVRLELTGPWPPYSFAEMRGRPDDDRLRRRDRWRRGSGGRPRLGCAG
ncbi:MAG: GvpL/GvpF family gas vesicle protein [Streptosporangiaceae bacterium]